MKDRPRVRGKFVWVGETKFLIKGVTYGTFLENAEGHLFPDREMVRRDFLLMKESGINTIRTYTLPPDYVMHEAAEQSLYVIPGVFWEGRRCIFDSNIERAKIRRTVTESVRRYSDHPALLAWCIGNEIPPDVVRWHGTRGVERFLKDLYHVAKDVDPDGLVTYATYPPTEYLDTSFFDICSYNVYLLREPEYRAYLARLQALAGDRPVLLSETGHDSLHSTEEEQAEVMEWQVRGAFEKGLCGVTLFAWTDEWAVGGQRIEDWKFGVVDEDRRPKQSLEMLSRLYSSDLCSLLKSPPSISVVVAAYNAEGTIEEALDSLACLNYPDYEVIVVDDCSTDRTAEIAKGYPVRLVRIDRTGLSGARNVGIEAADGEIVAFTDSDCIADPDWLFYLAARYAEGGVGGVGGPNIMPESDGWLGRCIDRSPGMPRHVLISPEIAEHIPGCNMSFYRSVLLDARMFDPVFTAAGDDVDVCWRVQDNGHELAFAPGAMVWHHRRASVRAYLRQQKGYGKAETLLAGKHPLKFSGLGGIRWNGSVYDGLRRLIRGQSKIYQGHFGAGQFQSIYYPHWAGWLYIATTPEWYAAGGVVAFAAAALFAFGVSAWTSLLGLAVFFVLSTGFVCAGAAYAAELPYTIPRRERLAMRAVIALLHMAQPLYRTMGRFSGGQVTKVIPASTPKAAAAPVELTDRYWSPYIERPYVLAMIHAKIREQNYYVDQGTGWEDWDLKVESGWIASARIVTAVEDQTILRFRIRASVNPALWVPVSAVMATVALALPPVASLAFNLPFLLALVIYGRRQCRRFEERLSAIAHETVRAQQFVPIEHTKRPRWKLFHAFSSRLWSSLRR